MTSETETKTCAACLSEIPAAAVRCQNCGADPRGPVDWSGVLRSARWLGILIVVWIGAFGISATFDDASTAEFILITISGIAALLGVIQLAVLIWQVLALKRRGARE